MFEKYEINKSTLAIIPQSKRISKIIEKEREIIINQSVKEIIDYSCKYFGSSYLGRFEGTKTLLGYNYKLPIIVEETKALIFFPTTSPKNEDCTWISLTNIYTYHKNNYGSKIIFKNNNEINLEISYNSLDNQILRASRLESILRKRQNN